jgi:sialic acid synthase SpsE
MVRSIRTASAANPDEIIAEMSSQRGNNIVEAVLGNGLNQLASAEEANYERTRRSLHAVRDIESGEILKADMFAPLRTEKILRPGLPPSWGEMILGRQTKNFIPAGEGIRFEDI